MASPAPWVVSDLVPIDVDGDRATINDAKGDLVGDIYGPSRDLKRNADRIVAAVNERPALLEALRECVRACDGVHLSSGLPDRAIREYDGAVNNARALLAAAGES